MAPEVVFLFPGLGSYRHGALHQASQEFAVVGQVLAEIDDALALPSAESLSRFVFDGDVTETQELLQAANYACSVATAKVLLECGVEPDVLVGHSFGEMAAMAIAGAVSIGDGAKVVRHRVTALRDWAGAGGMLAIGADLEAIGHLVGLARARKLVVACRNAPQQTVLSGPNDELAAVESIATALGLPVSSLAPPFPSHHPMMTPVIDVFLDLASDVVRRPFGRTVYSPMHGRFYGLEEDPVARFAEGVRLPVGFVDAVRLLHAQGARKFVETAVSRALVRSVGETVPGVELHAPLANPDTEVDALRAVIAALGGTRAAAPGGRPAVQPAAGPPRPAPQPVVEPLLEPEAPRGLEARPAPEPPREPTVEPSGRQDVVLKLRTLYAAALGYPVDLVTEEAQLEGDLGVDSLKQTALLNRALEDNGVRIDPRGVPIWQYGTVGHIADYVVDRRSTG